MSELKQQPSMDERALESITSPTSAPASNPIPSPHYISNDIVVPDLKLPSHATSCLIIYTGGTFGMTPDESSASGTTLSPTSGFLESKIASMDEFKFDGMPRVTVSEWETPIDSSDMNPQDWVRLATEIEAHYWEYDGFVILQGTDTMAYTASALSFMLEHLGKPVVLAGAMIPLHFPHSDARRNLIMSVMVASTLDIPEVVIYSNDKILRGNRTTKTSNMSTDAFASPNAPILATTGVEFMVDHAATLPHPRRRFSISTRLCTDICVFRLIPGFHDSGIRGFVEHHVRAKKVKGPDVCENALVFSLYGTGNAPLRKGEFLDLVSEALAAGIAVVVTSQCPYGRTKLDSYSTGIRLLEMGVITTFDMTTEACVTKLAYLMGRGVVSRQKLKEKMETNIRGELSHYLSSNVDTALSDGVTSSTNSGKVVHGLNI